MRRIVLAVMIAAAPCLVAYAQSTEQLTAGDVLRRDINEFFNVRNELTRTVSQMNAEFAAARKELAESAPGTPAHAKAQQKIDKLELGKNLSLLLPYIPYGVTTDSNMAMKIPEVLGGAKVDGGIPVEARPAFQSWVRSVRSSLGKGDGDFLMLNDSPAHVDRFMEALAENQSAYAAYVKAAGQARVNEANRRQDQANLAIAAEKSFEQAKLPGGGIALSRSQIVLVMESFNHFVGSPDGKIRELLFAESRKRGQQVLHCTYGPVPGARNQLAYETHYFWYQAPPANLDKLIAMDNEGILAILPKKPLTECPSSNQAQAMRRDAFFAHPTYCAKRAKYLKQVRREYNIPLPKRPNQKDPLEKEQREYNEHCS